MAGFLSGAAGGATVAIVIKAIDEFSSGFSKAQKSMVALGTVATAVFAGVSAIMMSSIQKASEYEAAQNRLATIVKNVGKMHGESAEAIQANTKALFDQAEALEKVGVADKNNISIVQSQLATFDLTTDAIHRLTPSILDYVIAEKGANATTEDFRQMTNGLAQALNGNFASLTRTGFVLDDATKALIKNGTEEERTAALAKVLGSTYDGMNKAATETAEGSLILLNRSLNDIKETIGKALIPIMQKIISTIQPIIEKIGAWVEAHPKLSAAILLIIGGLALLVMGIIAVTVAMTTLMAVSWPIVAIVLAIAAAIMGIILIFIYWKEILMWFIDVWLGFTKFLMIIWEKFKNFWEITWSKIRNFFIEIWNGIVQYAQDAINKLITGLNKIISAMNRVPGVNIPLIPKVDFGALKGELTDIDALISKQNAELDLYTAQLDAASELIKSKVADKINFDTKSKEPVQENNITITGDVYGTDPDDIADAVTKQLKDKISI